MKRSSSSQQWLQRQQKDPYVLQAQQQGWRSRAVFKLKEIQDKDKIIKPGMNIVDLGAAPGGWSQYAATLLAEKGKIFALDLLEMDPIEGVEFIQGDFREDDIYQQLLARLEGQQIGLVMSDIAPNMSGHKGIDQPKMMYIADLVLDFALKVLDENGVLLIKLFQGAEIDQYIKQTRTIFKQVIVRKPKASRDKSREFYLLAKGVKPNK